MKKIVFALVMLFGAIITHGQDKTRVACVGDSITFGYGIKKRQYNAYPAQLAKKLGKEYQVRNFGVSSSTLLNKGNKPYTKLKTYENALSFNPNIVIIKLGTNDTKPGNWKYSSEYVADYVSLIQSFRELESKPQVFICKPVPVYQTKSGINKKTIVEGIIPKIIEIAQKTNCEVIDLYTALSNKPEMFPDKIHPNKDGTGLIADAVYSAITGKKIAAQEQRLFPGKKKDFHGFDMYDDGATKVVVPKRIADGKPWVLRARFWGHQPQFDISMLKHGYHVVYCNVSDLFGSPKAVARWDEFYNYLRFEHLFADRVVLEGMSRGGLAIYNWAAANPEKVAVIYADAPVMDFKSWPAGKGKSKGSANAWLKCLEAYSFTEEEALAYTKNPIDNLEPLAKAGIPIIHVVGDNDKVVPVDENTAIAEKRYKELDGIFEVIHKANGGHHPHCLKDPSPIVDFIVKHNKGVTPPKAGRIPVSDKNFHMRGNYNNSRAVFEQTKRGHVAFLGGSITEMEGYRPMVCDFLKERFPQTEFTFTNAGISSTCSDTGAFRLEQDVLSQGTVDLLFVEFSVNDAQDGAFSKKRAIRGMEGIIAKVRSHNPKSDIVMTHFVNGGMLAALKDGKPHVSHDAHAAVAAHYSIANNDLAQELADQINAGTMVWKQYGGVHPNKTGNGMCASMIENALLKEWSRTLPADFTPVAHTKVALMDAMSYQRGRFVPAADIEMDEAWSISVPDWKSIEGNVRTRFEGSTMIHSTTVGSKLTIRFTGTAIGAYVLSGPDTGLLHCSIDGKEPVVIDPIHRHSGFHYPQTVMFFDDLENTEHTMTLEILDNNSKRRRKRKGGTAFRALHFTVN